MKSRALLVALCLVLLGAGWVGHFCAPSAKVLVLGFDGLDPRLLTTYMDAGQLPNFSRLAKLGRFRPLATTNPPQSPVAWSTFITGLEPAQHGIFDFVHRDPKTLTPVPSLNSVEHGESKLLRDGVPFWRYLEEAGVPARLVKIPANFPAVESSGTYLTDMGTPDLEGSYGTYSYYTDAPAHRTPPARAGGRRVTVEVREHRIRAALVGPRNEAIPFSVSLEPGQEGALISIQGQDVLLLAGEWSAWVPVNFPSAPGMVRLYLQSTQPHFSLYVSPANIDPWDPAVAISYPHRYSAELAQCCDRFYTQGMPEETAALLDGIFSDDEFLQQNDLVVQERQRLLDSELSRFREGLLFFYVSSTDILSHLYWNTIDPKHPGYSAERAKKYGDTILGVYRLADTFLGQVLSQVDQETTVIALSDHGFAPFHRAVHLNRWLRESGYQTALGTTLPDLDWSSTQAYAVGFNSLYLNLQGRESQGLVAPEQRATLLATIGQRLLALRDPQNGESVIAKVVVLEQPTDPILRERSPDLLIGYQRGYRASWETALGEAGPEIISDNLQAWSGDHLMSPDLVPGVLLVNRPWSAPSPRLLDLAPTLLDLYQVPIPPEMSGRSLLR